MTRVFSVCRHLDILFDRFSKSFPFIVHLGRCVCKGHISPFFALAHFDEFLAVLAKTQCAIGADHLALEGRRAFGITDGDGGAGQAVLIADKGGGRVVGGLVMGPGADRRRDRDGL